MPKTACDMLISDWSSAVCSSDLAEPFGLSLGAISLIYLVYALGTGSSIVSGHLADRLDRRQVIPAGIVMALAGVLLTLSSWLPVIVLGMALVTMGFFCLHGLASSRSEEHTSELQSLMRIP